VEELTGAIVRAAWVRGNGIELVRKLQWEVGVLAEHWVERVGRQRHLTMAGRSNGGVVATVVKWRRSRGGEMQPRKRVIEVVEDSWMCCENKEALASWSSGWQSGDVRGGLGCRRRDVKGREEASGGCTGGGRAS
jgi:hypothetical protein